MVLSCFQNFALLTAYIIPLLYVICTLREATGPLPDEAPGGFADVV